LTTSWERSGRGRASATQLQRAQGVGRGQGVESGGGQFGAGAQVVNGGERAFGAGRHDLLRPFLAETLDAPKTQSQGSAPVAGEGVRRGRRRDAELRCRDRMQALRQA
jgi:hypothetical protein